MLFNVSVQQQPKAATPRAEGVTSCFFFPCSVLQSRFQRTFYLGEQVKVLCQQNLGMTYRTMRRFWGKDNLVERSVRPNDVNSSVIVLLLRLRFFFAIDYVLDNECCFELRLVIVVSWETRVQQPQAWTVRSEMEQKGLQIRHARLNHPTTPPQAPFSRLVSYISIAFEAFVVHAYCLCIETYSGLG
jgi:hypothetical protein